MEFRQEVNERQVGFSSLKILFYGFYVQRYIALMYIGIPCAFLMRSVARNWHVITLN